MDLSPLKAIVTSAPHGCTCTCRWYFTSTYRQRCGRVVSVGARLFVGNEKTWKGNETVPRRLPRPRVCLQCLRLCGSGRVDCSTKDPPGSLSVCGCRIFIPQATGLIMAWPTSLVQSRAQTVNELTCTACGRVDLLYGVVPYTTIDNCLAASSLRPKMLPMEL
jgi:hypothetical protein